MRMPIPALAACAVLLAPAAYAQGTDAEAESGYVPLHRYLVTTTHTPEQCLAVLDELAAEKRKTLSRMQWGCAAGDHSGYLFVETSDEETALKLLPESSRRTAKIVEVTKFTPKQLETIHKRMEQDKAAASKRASK